MSFSPTVFLPLHWTSAAKTSSSNSLYCSSCQCSQTSNTALLHNSLCPFPRIQSNPPKHPAKYPPLVWSCSQGKSLLQPVNLAYISGSSCPTWKATICTELGECFWVPSWLTWQMATWIWECCSWSSWNPKLAKYRLRVWASLIW